ALAVHPVDLRRPQVLAHAHQVAEAHELARARAHGQVVDVLGRAPLARFGAQPDVVLLVAFLVLGDRLAGDVGLHGGGDVLHVDAQVGGLVTVDQEAQLGRAHGERGVDVDQAGELPHAGHQPVGV